MSNAAQYISCKIRCHAILGEMKMERRVFRGLATRPLDEVEIRPSGEANSRLGGR